MAYQKRSASCWREWFTSSWSGSNCSRLRGVPRQARNQERTLDIKQRVEFGAGAAAALVGAAAVSYAALVGSTWLRYGHVDPQAADEKDPLLSVFMPKYDVSERHHVGIAAPADVTFDALMDMNLDDSLVVRAIFKGRELLLGAEPDAKPKAHGLVAMTKELGWVVLAEMPGHEIV